MAISVSEGLDLIASTGVRVQVKKFNDVTIAERNARLRLLQSPPSPSTVANDLKRTDAIVLYVVPHVTASLLAIARANQNIAVVGVNDGIFVFEGRELESPAAEAAPSRRPHQRRIAWGRFALMRALARTRRPRTQSQLADETGISQVAVSQSLNYLRDFVLKTPDGWSTIDPRPISEAFLESYPGPRGISRGWYALTPVIDQADRAARVGGPGNTLISGDAGADRIAPWHRPSNAVIYSTTGLDLTEDQFSEATHERATLYVVVPADPTIWPVARAYQPDNVLEVVDPLICAYDVQEAGGSDAREAVDHLLRHVERNWHRAT